MKEVARKSKNRVIFFIVGLFLQKGVPKIGTPFRLFENGVDYIIRNDIITPAATAEPITPETFGAMACMRRWFDGSYF